MVYRSQTLDFTKNGENGNPGLGIASAYTRWTLTTEEGPNNNLPDNENEVSQSQESVFGNWYSNFDAFMTDYVNWKKSYTDNNETPPQAYIWSQEVKKYDDNKKIEYGNATRNTANSFIAQWLDTTTIEGSNIYTGKIEASSINVTDLTAFGATINELDIRDLTGKVEQFSGKNLLVNTSQNGDLALMGANHSEYVEDYSNVDGLLTLKFNANGEEEAYYRFMDPSKSQNNLYCLEVGKTYTISGLVKLSTESGSVNNVVVRTQAFKGSGWYGGIGGSILTNDTDEWTSFSKTFTIEADATGYYISVQLYYAGTSYKGTLQLKNLKLEEGRIATPWSAADDGSLPSSSNSSNFSWKFSTTEGMFMWNGPQHSATDTDSASGKQYGPTRGAVLAVYNDNGTHKLAMRGRVEADSGFVAGWELIEGTLQSGETKLYGSGSALCYLPQDVTCDFYNRLEQEAIQISAGSQNLICADDDADLKKQNLNLLYSGVTLDPKRLIKNRAFQISIKLYNRADRRIEKVNITSVSICNTYYNDLGEEAFRSSYPVENYKIIYLNDNTLTLSITTPKSYSPDENSKVHPYLGGSYNYLEVNSKQVPSLAILQNGDIYAKDIWAKTGMFENLEVVAPYFTFGLNSATGSFTFSDYSVGSGGVYCLGPSGLYEASTTDFIRGTPQLFGRRIYRSEMSEAMFRIEDETLIEGLKINSDGYTLLASRGGGMKILADYQWKKDTERGYGPYGLGNTLLLTAHRVELVSGSGVNGVTGGIYFNSTSYDDKSVSDARKKHAIEDLPIEYETFFDKLHATRYKYNNGTSDRYHTGYIAQEVEQSLLSSGLTTQEFAGIMLDGAGTPDECWYLRRDEFVALNTWQIQKLKPRMDSAEAKLLVYETRISKLEQELENLKSS